MDAPEIEKLKALALAATPGEWKNYHGLIEDEMAGFGIATVRAYFAENEAIQAANAAYIAASCPATVLALIAEVESLRADAERYRWLRNEAEGMAGKAAPMVCRLDERGRFVDYLDGEELDDHIDRAAIAASKEKA